MPTHAIDHAATAAAAVRALEDRQSTWRPAEIVRETAAAVPVSVAMRAAAVVSTVEAIAAHAQQGMVDLSRLAPLNTPLRADGRPVTESAADRALTTPRILQQEQRLRDLATERLGRDWQPNNAALARSTVRLDHGQAELPVAAAGDAPLVLAVGPDGTGKTTALQPAVTQLHAEGRAVFGVAPSAVAAEVLSTATGIDADTLDKLLLEYRKPQGPATQYTLGAGATIVVDEAGMVSTPNLAELFDLAENQQWRLVLIGDPLQFSAVGRGGMFGHLIDQCGAIELGRVQRFTNAWERAASLELRRGNTDVLDTYHAHGRLHGGTLQDMQHATVAAWHGARTRGDDALMLAGTNYSVVHLNHLAQQLRAAVGEIPTGDTVSAGVYKIGVGDDIVTRQNDRNLTTDQNMHVHNRDRWTVTALHRDGAITAHSDKGTVRLPADYVQAHVELGYAQTAHAAQGRTVDHSYLLVDGPTDARGVYVPMTRGRETNHAYVVTQPGQTPIDVLASAVSRHWIDRPALETDAANALLTPGELRTLRPELHTAQRELYDLHDTANHARNYAAFARVALEPVSRNLSDELKYNANLTTWLEEHDTAWRIRGRQAIHDHRKQLAHSEQRLAELRERFAPLAAERAKTAAAHSAADGALRTHGPGLERRIHELDHHLTSDRNERGRRAEQDPPEYLVDLIGRPPQNERRGHWRNTAGEIEQSRTRHNIHNPEHALRLTPEQRTPTEHAFAQESTRTADELHRTARREQEVRQEQAMRISR